ncbi:NUMOD4 domain-containing protein [Caballeronia sp. LZ029]|uniref:NUMOD4 domain-containing protein n=1 Tax=Caballeronia sp. LZ029 TaxID=3038564 RepID=UPI00285723B9|nr:NUMOD4 domain-containing protein [Caballeronia sp. LZ029]MDR5741534.1 NUMOD4 domain-containing protein [Caballeronia sp. LZ029]
MIEFWRDIPGYEGFYQASDLGNVRSVDRNHINHKGTVRVIRGKLLSLVPESGRYFVVELSRNGVQKRRYVHQLVMEAFVGPCPPGMQVSHTHDRNQQNSRLGNLRYDTPTGKTGDTGDKYAHGTLIRKVKPPKAVAAVQSTPIMRKSRLTKEHQEEIRRRRAAGETGMSIAREFGVSQPRIRQIVLGV